ncbi:MAG: PhoX family protein [Litorivicinus sp.]
MDKLSFDEWDETHAPERAADTDFDGVMSRRYFLRGAALLGASAFVVKAGLMPNAAMAASKAGFKFTPIAASTADAITLPEGFTSQVVVRWGDPLTSDTPDFDHATRGSAASQASAVGDNNDGMDLFEVEGRNVLVFNNEYTNRSITFGNRESKLPETDDDVDKGKLAHGLTLVELKEQNGQWVMVKDSPLNRRVTPDTPFEVVGPVRGSRLIQTAADPQGTRILGTFNNCGNGRTPWGTYLACEENFNGYFSSSQGEAFEQNAEQKRYGIANSGKDWGYAWAQTDARFDVTAEPNEPNRHGWVVEVDPAGRKQPVKLTALGRFKHENAEVVIAKNGKVVVYLGDDERGEFLYRFVSRDRYQPDGDNSRLLHEGELFVAKFHDDGRGEWINLKEAGMSPDETLVYARIAGTQVGATTMDRPEWVAANPHKVEAYVALTNNKYRGERESQPVNAANPRIKNPYGHIVRWTPADQDHAADQFEWDMYVMAGNPRLHADAMGGSPNVTADNMFNSPDGLKFDTAGNLWIQTDGNYSNEKGFAGMGNNQMLMGDPQTGEIHRFMVGPKECEITGLTWSADRKTLFVGIQHPGERGGSHWPEGGDSVPRSAIVAVKRVDGGIIA